MDDEFVDSEAAYRRLDRTITTILRGFEARATDGMTQLAAVPIHNVATDLKFGFHEVELEVKDWTRRVFSSPELPDSFPEVRGVPIRSLLPQNYFEPLLDVAANALVGRMWAKERGVLELISPKEEDFLRVLPGVPLTHVVAASTLRPFIYRVDSHFCNATLYRDFASLKQAVQFSRSACAVIGQTLGRESVGQLAQKYLVCRERETTKVYFRQQEHRLSSVELAAQRRELAEITGVVEVARPNLPSLAD